MEQIEQAQVATENTQFENLQLGNTQVENTQVENKGENVDTQNGENSCAKVENGQPVQGICTVNEKNSEIETTQQQTELEKNSAKESVKQQTELEKNNENVSDKSNISNENISEKNEVVQSNSDDIKQIYLGENWNDTVREFVEKYPLAKSFVTDIGKELLTDQTLACQPLCLELALNRVLTRAY
ncbi:MAG: hypothetical protein RR993_03480, partial [Clostridia bacterium]